MNRHDLTVIFKSTYNEDSQKQKLSVGWVPRGFISMGSLTHLSFLGEMNARCNYALVYENGHGLVEHASRADHVLDIHLLRTLSGVPSPSPGGAVRFSTRYRQ